MRHHVDQKTIDFFAEVSAWETAIFEACKLAARAGDMQHHGYSHSQVQAALAAATAAVAKVDETHRYLASQDASYVFGVHSMHRTVGAQTTFDICHICGDGIPD